MDQLIEASEAGNIDGLYAAIRNNPKILSMIAKMPFIDTPLHVAASKGHFRFAAEITSLKPSLARKLNQDGFSPMHLALQNGQFQTARRLLDMDRELVRVKGRGGVTPLHYAAELGKIDLLTEFLVACPNSIQDLTICRETALHVAAKNEKWEAFRVLCGSVKFNGRNVVLNSTDDEGNTVLHIATSKCQIEVVEFLISKAKMDLNVKNMNNKTALDILDEPVPPSNRTKAIRHILSRAGALNSSKLRQTATLADTLTKNMSVLERWALSVYRQRQSMSDENRNAVLVVAVLIATATYQAVITPPRGILEADPTLLHPQADETSDSVRNRLDARSSMGEPTLWYIDPVVWILFSTLNTATFIITLVVIYSLLPKRPLIILPLIIPLFLCFGISWFSAQVNILVQWIFASIGAIFAALVAIPVVFWIISKKFQKAWGKLVYLISGPDSSETKEK